MHYSSVSNRSYRNASPSSGLMPSQRYEHTRRKTEWAEPNYLYPYQYDYLNANEDVFRNRADLIIQLEEQKIYNRRSNVIIQQLLEEKKKREKEERTASRLAKEAAYQKELELRRQRNEMRSSKLLDQYRSTKQNVNTSVGYKSPEKTDKKNKAKQDILNKLYDKSDKSDQTPKLNKNQQSPYKAGLRDKQAGLALEILKQQVNFLKQQIAQKNNSIVELQCEVVRLQKVQKIMLQMQNQDKIKEEVQTPRRQSSKTTAELGLYPKCINVMIQSRKTKNKMKLFQIDSFNIEGKREPLKTQSYAQTKVIQKAKMQENFTQTEPAQSQIRLQLQSNIMCYSIEVGSKIGQSQIDFKLSTSGPLLLESNKGEPKVEKTEKESQTDSKECQNRDSQTSQNYYDYIEKTYLEWMFEKDYKQIQQKKKAKQEQK